MWIHCHILHCHFHRIHIQREHLHDCQVHYTLIEQTPLIEDRPICTSYQRDVNRTTLCNVQHCYNKGVQSTTKCDSVTTMGCYEREACNTLLQQQGPTTVQRQRGAKKGPATLCYNNTTVLQQGLVTRGTPPYCEEKPCLLYLNCVTLSAVFCTCAM